MPGIYFFLPGRKEVAGLGTNYCSHVSSWLTVGREEAYGQFMSDKFGVLQFTMETFYENVVAEHVTDICDNVGGTESDSDTDESIDI